MCAGVASGEARRRVGEDAPDLAAALMAQRPRRERPREDALLEAERSHQRRRIERPEEHLECLEEHLEEQQGKSVESEIELQEPLEISKEMRKVAPAGSFPLGHARPAGRAGLALVRGE